MPSVTRIPLIDFSGVREGDAAALVRVGHEIREACTTLGFFYIVNPNSGKCVEAVSPGNADNASIDLAPFAFAR